MAGPYRGLDRVRRVGVVATGMVGAGWAAFFLSRGLEVSAYGRREEAGAELRELVATAWRDLEQIGLPANADRDALTFTTDLEAALDGCDFVQENTAENEALKIALYARMDAVLPQDVLIASSTSSLSMTRLQSECRHPERCVLGHPFTPTHLLPLVEIVGGEKTDPAAIDTAMELYAGLGKRPVRLNREIFGHIANRLAAALLREAVHLVTEGVASVEDIDAAIVNGPGRKWAVTGPFLSYHLTGGEGGFAQFLAHFGAGMQRRWDGLGRPDLTPEIRQLLTDEVAAATAAHSRADYEADRARRLIAITTACGTG